MNAHRSVETFESLSVIPGVKHAFTLRVPDVDVCVDREEALERLEPYHMAVVKELGYELSQLKRAQQVHGAGVAIVDRNTSEAITSEVDGLITNDPEVILGIYVADCGAIYVVDPTNGAFGLLHSGKKGSELDILGHAVRLMKENFGSDPAQLVVQLSPCIRPPHYEIDFAQWIKQSAEKVGVLSENFHDEGFCTAANVDRYYSYRLEKGKTGRMLALLGQASDK